jgi:hypothetical protein
MGGKKNSSSEEKYCERCHDVVHTNGLVDERRILETTLNLILFHHQLISTTELTLAPKNIPGITMIHRR